MKIPFLLAEGVEEPHSATSKASYDMKVIYVFTSHFGAIELVSKISWALSSKINLL